jgi:hypothetical protein
MLNGWTIGIARFVPEEPPEADPKADAAHIYMACPLCDYVVSITDEVEGQEVPFDDTREWIEAHEATEHPTYVALQREALSLVTV